MNCLYNKCVLTKSLEFVLHKPSHPMGLVPGGGGVGRGSVRKGMGNPSQPQRSIAPRDPLGFEPAAPWHSTGDGDASLELLGQGYNKNENGF